MPFSLFASTTMNFVAAAFIKNCAQLQKMNSRSLFGERRRQRRGKEREMIKVYSSGEACSVL